MIRALIFDCFGVLYSEGKRSVEVLCSPDTLDELKSLYYQSDYGYISRDEFIHRVSELTGLDEAGFIELEKSQFVRNQPLFEFIQLQKLHYKIGMLSNVGEEFVESLFTQKEREELFDTVVLSSSVGVTKPARAIFEIAAQRLGALPEECVFVDDMPANVEGAKIVGMQAFLFTTNHQFEVDLDRILS